jgi:hypothetical protein
MAEAHAPFLIADDDKRGKAEAAAAFHHFCYAVDVDELVHKLAIALLTVAISASFTWFTSHELALSFFSGPSLSQALKIQSRFARRIGQRLDAPMIDIGAAVENHVLDASLQSARRNQLSNLGRSRNVGAFFEAALQLAIDAGRRRKRMAIRIVDDLGIDVLGRTEHRKTGTFALSPPQGPADTRLAAVET